MARSFYTLRCDVMSCGVAHCGLLMCGMVIWWGHSIPWGVMSCGVVHCGLLMWMWSFGEVVLYLEVWRHVMWCEVMWFDAVPLGVMSCHEIWGDLCDAMWCDVMWCLQEGDEVDVKALQDKLKQTETKMAEWRNQCQMLKQEIKVSHKVTSVRCWNMTCKAISVWCWIMAHKVT